MLLLTPQSSIVPEMNTSMPYRMQFPSPEPKTPEIIPKDTTNDPPPMPPSTISYHHMRKRDAKERQPVTSVERKDTSPAIVTKSQPPKIIIKGTTSEEMEQEEELREKENLTIPIIPRKKPTIPWKLPIHRIM